MSIFLKYSTPQCSIHAIRRQQTVNLNNTVHMDFACKHAGYLSMYCTLFFFFFFFFWGGGVLFVCSFVCLFVCFFGGRVYLKLSSIQISRIIFVCSMDFINTTCPEIDFLSLWGFVISFMKYTCRINVLSSLCHGFTLHTKVRTRPNIPLLLNWNNFVYKHDDLPSANDLGTYIFGSQ